MENREDRRAEMIAQAEQTMTESRYREAMARTATTYVAGALALGLREQGLSDKAIGEVLTVSRNRVPDLVKEGIWPSPMLSDDRLLRYVTAAVEDLYRPIAHPTAGWVHSLTGLSGRIAIANGVSIPPPFRPNEGRGLDTIAAQFDNLDTGERILVYSLERHHGQVLFDAEMRLAGYDFMGYYRIDLCSPAGARQSYPLEVLGISSSDLRFGKKWETVEERRSDDDAFRNAVSAVRRHYGVWPRAALIDVNLFVD